MEQQQTVLTWIASFKWWLRKRNEMNPRLTTVCVWLAYQEVPEGYNKEELAKAIWENL